MPIFNWHFRNKGKPQLHLARYGLQVKVELGTHRLIHKNLTEQGVSTSAPIAGSGIIDTGATRTAIDLTVANEL